MGSDTPVGADQPSDPLDLDAIEVMVDDRLRSWLQSAPDALTADARAVTSATAERIRGQWLVVGAQTGPAEIDPTAVLPAATSVELIYEQAVANAEATGFATGGLDRDHALLVSDYLHSLAYAVMGNVEAEQPVKQACFGSLSSASQRLASLWTTLQDAQTDDSVALRSVPIDPIVLATAGELAGILGDSDPGSRSALRKTGAAIGIARWQPSERPATEARTAIVDETFSAEWSAADVLAVGEHRSLGELLDPLPDSPATETLRSFATSLLSDTVDQRPMIHE